MKAISKWIKSATRQVFDPDHEERIRELSANLYNAMRSGGEKFSLLAFVKQAECTTSDLELAKRRVYQSVLSRAWQDDKVTAAEKKTIDWVIARLRLPLSEAKSLQLSVARDRFAASLSAAMEDGILDDSEAAHLEQIARSVDLELGDFVRSYFRTEGEEFLRGVFSACTEGGVLADDAWTRLGVATKRLGLSKRDLLSTVRLQAERFVEHVLADAKSDGELSEDEEAVLTQLLKTLELSTESCQYVRNCIASLRTIRLAREGKLPLVAPPVGIAIRSGEIVHFHRPGTWLQKRVNKSGEHWDQHVGMMIITDNRILFSSDTKSFDVRFSRVVSHSGSVGVIRMQRMEKPESVVQIIEDEPIAYAIFEGALALSNQTRLAKEGGLPKRHIPREVRQRVWQRYGAQCAECGAKQYLEFDHIIPVAKGGSNTDTNVQLLCRGCNLKKSDRI